MNSPRTFFVNGHKCEVECVGRAQWHGYLDGEKFTEASRSNQVRNVLQEDAKYRVETEPELEAVVEAVYGFIDAQDMWTTKGLIRNKVFPEDDFTLLLGKALNLLKEYDCIEESEVMNGLNAEEMYRPTPRGMESFKG